jgi:hypothetical protein
MPRVDDQEFYQLPDKDGLTDDIHLFNEKLQEWEEYDHYHRPQGALDGQTPYERLVTKTRAGPAAVSCTTPFASVARDTGACSPGLSRVTLN